MKDKLLKQHQDTEAALEKKHKDGKQQQIRNLEDKMALLRKRRFDKLRDEQEKYKNEVSEKYINNSYFSQPVLNWGKNCLHE
jgi:hypothetical protein